MKLQRALCLLLAVVGCSPGANEKRERQGVIISGERVFSNDGSYLRPPSAKEVQGSVFADLASCAVEHFEVAIRNDLTDGSLFIIRLPGSKALNFSLVCLRKHLPKGSVIRDERPEDQQWFEETHN